jgi:hypothetical protein
VDGTERAELIAALHQAATFREGPNERLLDALATGDNRPDVKNWSTCEPACHGGVSRSQP